MDYYVYEHWRLDTDRPFYVGKGKKGRAYAFKGRGEHYQEIWDVLKKNDWQIDVRIVVRCLSEREAFRIEMERIAFWKESGVVLVNKTNGGDGTWGLKYTEARRQKLSKKLKGQTRTEEQCRNISLGQKKKAPPSEETRLKISVAGKNRKFSEEHKQRISASLKDKPKSEEHCKSIRKAAKTRKNPKRSPEARANMSAAQKRVVRKVEHIERVRALGKSNKGRKHTVEARKIMSIRQTGRRHPEETKQKMRVAALKREARKRELGIVQKGHVGFKHDEAAKQKMRAAALARVAQKRLEKERSTADRSILELSPQ